MSRTSIVIQYVIFTLLKMKWKFGRNRVKSHIWLTASLSMAKYTRLYSFVRKPFLIYGIAPVPFPISLHINKKKIPLYFYQCNWHFTTKEYVNFFSSFRLQWGQCPYLVTSMIRHYGMRGRGRGGGGVKGWVGRGAEWRAGWWVGWVRQKPGDQPSHYLFIWGKKLTLALPEY